VRYSQVASSAEQPLTIHGCRGSVAHRGASTRFELYRPAQKRFDGLNHAENRIGEKDMLKFTMVPGVVLGLLLLSGCDTLGPDLFNKLPLEPVGAKEQGQEDLPLGGIEGQSPSDEEEKPTSEYYTGTGNFVRPGGGHPGGRARGARHGKYTLNFDDADLGEVAKVILSDTLNVNYVLSPQVAGTVNLQTSHPLTREELIPTLEMVLRMNGAVLLRDGDLYRIEPESKALQSAQPPQLGGRIPIGYQVRVIPLRYVGVKEMQSILEPLLPPKAILRADAARNLLMIAGTSDELENIIDTVSIFDVDVMQGMSVGLFTLKNVDVATVITELETLFGEATEGPLAGMFRLLPIERLNAILVITPQPKYLYEAESWIDRLDRTVTAVGGGVNVYRVQNVDAVELAATLNDIFGGTGKSTPRASLAPGLKAREISGSRDGESESKPPPRSVGTGSMDVADVGKNVRIIADERNNALIVVATKQEYEVIARVIKQLDVTPLQVLIDATIVEVTLSDNLQYGIQWFFKNSLPGDHTGRAVLTENLQDLALAVASGGFSYSIVNNANDVRFVLNALAEDQKINVIASPSLMVLDNQEATINVGDQVPIATSQSTNTSSANVGIGGDTSAIVTNQIQLINTGVTLKVKPRVNAGGLVIMDIEQEANVPVETTTSGLDSPTIQQRKIESSIAVQSGETIVLGGLIQDRRNHRRDGVPFFSKIPYIGALFGSTQKELNRTELVVLITPRVVQHEQDARDITREFKRKLTGIYSNLPVPVPEEAQPSVDMDESVN
jgi:general secretion pathway protein D